MHSGSSSSWSVDFHPPLDFALWCLQIDGLAVPPFDAHASGTGQLVGAGLTPRLWVGWVRSLVGAHAEIGAVLAGRALSLSDPEALGAVKAAVETAVDPLARFEAQGPLRAELHTLWSEYEAGSYERSDLTRRSVPDNQRDVPSWRSMSSYLDRLGSLSLFVCRYPVTRVMVLPPRTILLGWDFENRSGPSWKKAVLDGASTLATMGG